MTTGRIALRTVAPRTNLSVVCTQGASPVATGWTLDMSTPLLPQGVPEENADPLSLE